MNIYNNYLLLIALPLCCTHAIGMEELEALLNDLQSKKQESIKRELTPEREKKQKETATAIAKLIEELETPIPQPKTSKKIIGACIGIPAILLIVGYGIYKLTPYIRKKIKEWNNQATMQVSTTTTPVSIATADQMPA